MAQVDPEYPAVVGVEGERESGLPEPAQGVPGQVRDGTRAQVGREFYFDGRAGVDSAPEEFRVLGQAYAVADARDDLVSDAGYADQKKPAMRRSPRSAQSAPG